MFGPIAKVFRNQSVLRFLTVGVASFGVDYALLLGLYHLASVPLAVATTIGFLVGLLLNFSLNKYWTFAAPRGAKHSARQAVLYGLLVVVNLIFTDVFVVALAGLSLGPAITKPIATAAIVITNYVVYQKVIFKPYDASELSVK